MLIAVVTDGRSAGAVVPESYEESAQLLIVETDTDAVVAKYNNRDADGLFFAAKVVQHDCEAIVCGKMQRAGFEKIADNSVTRYLGSGLPILEAAHAAEDNLLPFITDFEGGTGCGGDSHDKDNCEMHLHESE